VRLFSIGLSLVSLCLTACSETPAAAQSVPPPPVQVGQRGDGAPYEILGSEVWDVPDPVSGRLYQVFVQLPPSYGSDPDRHYPVLYVTDADYAFPIIRQIARRVNLNDPMVVEFILVGLSYAVGEGGARSRARDYTPVRINDRTGGGEAYQTYLKTQVLPFIEGRFSADPERRIFMGHSYGGLLGAQILFSEPELFDGYLLGSPSFWFADQVMFQREADYARTHADLPARIYMYIGEYEVPGVERRRNIYDMVGDNARFAARLQSRNYQSLSLSHEILNDEDHLTVAPRGITKGLLALLPAS